ncbi:glycolipid transfer protein 3-like isoform X3 [Papaver somniferum]|uniref:glycolipid transfer protein 3-like isoform X3 n=1 Tax=Papaver somniferum TaxID=3469 RepID=UPI000E6FA4C3|nr:glycolipid transfer protein 3-like isoform X3 [Papaver somniferum]
MKRKRGSEQILGKDEIDEFKGSEIRSAILELTKISSLHHHEPASVCDSKNDVAADAAATTVASTTTTSTSSTAHFKSHDHHIPTKSFLHVCKSLLLQVLDKVGPTMAVLRQDVHQNIQRLEKLHDMDPSMYRNVVGILKKEAGEGTSRKTNSCTRALVWLTRLHLFWICFVFICYIVCIYTMFLNLFIRPWLPYEPISRRSLDFAVSLLEKLCKEPDGNLKKAVEESYEVTLKPWHQWISAAAYQL